MQIDPIKPTPRAPGIKLLELKYGQPLSKIAFKFNLRRYIKEGDAAMEEDLVGRCSRYQNQS